MYDIHYEFLDHRRLSTDKIRKLSTRAANLRFLKPTPVRVMVWRTRRESLCDMVNLTTVRDSYAIHTVRTQERAEIT